MEESRITRAQFINADIALKFRSTHLVSPDQQGDSSCPYRPCGVLCQSLRKVSAQLEAKQARTANGFGQSVKLPSATTP